MPITFLSAGEEVFILRLAGDALMVEFAFLFIKAPLKVATSTESFMLYIGMICTQFGASRKSLIASLTFIPCAVLFQSFVVTDFVLCIFFHFKILFKTDESGRKWMKAEESG